MSDGNCRVCGKRGHYSYSCPVKRRETVCYNCGVKGHAVGQCPRPPKHEASDAGCFTCGQRGHMARSCPEIHKQRERARAAAKAAAPPCQQCGLPGHRVQHCPMPLLTVCAQCKRKGHFTKDCPTLVHARAVASSSLGSFWTSQIGGTATPKRTPVVAAAASMPKRARADIAIQTGTTEPDESTDEAADGSALLGLAGYGDDDDDDDDADNDDVEEDTSSQPGAMAVEVTVPASAHHTPSDVPAVPDALRATTEPAVASPLDLPSNSAGFPPPSAVAISRPELFTAAASGAPVLETAACSAAGNDTTWKDSGRTDPGRKQRGKHVAAPETTPKEAAVLQMLTMPQGPGSTG
eukprot:TRINITY_DN1618_c0_g3_i1.p1 TRINITY_DN1618_c0_g3~~TRINITY_DN1618_c0_g3_i1.p1  ORF type:complete len:351 (-),score=34.19 TRINITY_DN1618_c0_g3_i1:16-1068(-)